MDVWKRGLIRVLHQPAVSTAFGASLLFQKTSVVFDLYGSGKRLWKCGLISGSGPAIWGQADGTIGSRYDEVSRSTRTAALTNSSVLGEGGNRIIDGALLNSTSYV